MGLGVKDKGLSKKEKKKDKPIDTDNSMLITRGKGGWEDVEEGKGEINHDERRLGVAPQFTIIQYNIQMMYYRIICLKPTLFY